MRNILILSLLIITLLLFGCNLNYDKSIEIMKGVNSRFNIETMDISWENESMKLKFYNESYLDSTSTKLEMNATTINKYLKKNYPIIDSLSKTKYLYMDNENIEIMEFTFDQDGNLLTIKNYD